MTRDVNELLVRNLQSVPVSEEEGIYDILLDIRVLLYDVLEATRENTDKLNIIEISTEGSIGLDTETISDNSDEIRDLLEDIRDKMEDDDS